MLVILLELRVPETRGESGAGVSADVTKLEVGLGGVVIPTRGTVERGYIGLHLVISEASLEEIYTRVVHGSSQTSGVESDRAGSG